ncbi:MAG: methyltransferase domain-containing protein [Nakamurella sp.]
MNDAMQAEFDTVAEWTAEVALDLGPEYYVPAACRGSGSPATLRWLIDGLAIGRSDRMLDCGAGAGGPAAFAAELSGVAPILTEPEVGACRAAQRLFGSTVLQAASDLPLRSGSFAVAWSLGVLCTVSDQPLLLRELRRVLGGSGRLGLLVFVATGELPADRPEGNNFPTWDRLVRLLADAGLAIDAAASEVELDAAPADWTARADAVHDELARRHGSDDRWLTSVEQSKLIGGLLSNRQVVGTAIIASPVRS